MPGGNGATLHSLRIVIVHKSRIVQCDDWAGHPRPMSRTKHPFEERLPVLGVDVGRVIIAPGEGEDDTFFLRGPEEEALETPPTEACFETLAALTEAFEGRVWIVSKAGPKIADR